MHTKAICKPTTRCSQLYYLHCYAMGSSSSNQCLNSMALMVVATRESDIYISTRHKLTGIWAPYGAYCTIRTKKKRACVEVFVILLAHDMCRC